MTAAVGRPPRKIPGATWSSLCLMLYEHGSRRVVSLKALGLTELYALARQLVEEIDSRREEQR